jgi:hypothetical protein
MILKCTGWAVCVLAFLPMLSPAQGRVRENAVPLKNWATPLYWHPNQAEQAAAVPALHRNAAPQAAAAGTSAETLNFVALTPCRLVDTRGATQGFNGWTPFSGPSIPGGTTVTFPLQSTVEASTSAPAPCGVIAPDAQAYSLNLTVVPYATGSVDYVQIWPAGNPQPYVSNINDVQGQIVANAVIVAAGTPSGGISLFNFGPATIDVIIDLNGYFTTQSYVSGNTTVGPDTLANNINGSYNTADGANSLYSNTTGGFNTASGSQSLESNTTGSVNTAIGASGLFSNTTGSNNTVFGYLALQNNTTGNGNTAVGALAGSNAPPGNSYSVYVGTPGLATDTNGTIAIGTIGTHLAFYSAGVNATTVGEGDALPVLIDSDGQMGTNLMTAASMEDIQEMADASSRLLNLRPVTFHNKKAYKDGSKPLDYGLVAEEVAQVYPDLAVKSKDGKLVNVQYQKLTPMLLNELQKQAAQIRSLEDRLAALVAGSPSALGAAPKPAR